MAWSDNEGQNRDPWGNRGGEQGPPDLDDAFRKLRGQLSGMFGGGGGSGSGSSGKKGFRLSPGLILLVVFILVVVWFAFGWYQVDAQERGVVLRLGKVQEIFTEPGLNWNPKFIDEVIKVNTTRINSSEHSQQMLTEDDNIVKVDLVVQFRVSDPIKYVVDIREPEESLKHAAESALRHVVGGSTMEAVITTGREVLGDDVKDRLQTYLNRYETGIEVVGVNIEAVEPPQEVQAAFDDVQKAKEDQVKFINEANALAEQVVPEARGEASRIIESANAYRDQVIALAQGEADRFTKLLIEYQAAKEVTKDRLYITAIETVLKSTSIVMVDVSGGNNLLLLQPDQLLRGGTSSLGMSDNVPASNSPSTTFPVNLRSNSRSGQ
ncbi:MAG: FtsH protease activity modulator HflK [Gammaproteobacteria bacterium]|nr:FtsH protease activity modulator HflK [Gammaproteobacteria bacterium]MYD81105.1 FtsH protease activity modulator HflK [Gammaproteobacteria bacterium]